MDNIERRRCVRKVIRMACEVRFAPGITVSGITRNISLEGVEVEPSSVSASKDRMPGPGESGLLTLKFRHAGSPDSIMAQCQMVHVLGNGMGLSARFSEFNKREQEMLGRMLASGRAQIDELVAQA